MDGLGNALTDYEDPNVPSLLAIPLLGYPLYNRTIYANTRARILSDENKFYYKGALPGKCSRIADQAQPQVTGKPSVMDAAARLRMAVVCV